MVDLPKLPALRLDGKRALVTGASRGIGLGCAAALAEIGADVTMAARGEAQLAEAVEAVTTAGGKASALKMDVADVPAMEQHFSQMPAFDVIVNAAGMARHGPSMDTELDDYQAVMDVNCRGAYFISQLAARRMAAEKIAGSIIHISSQMGHVGGQDRAVYCASKHAVEGMTKAMAIEWGPMGIRINTIGPTFIRTPLTESTFQNPERVAWIKSKIKLDRIGEIEDVMGAVVYLATPASALVTGTALLIDGGWTAD